jgi:uncharacterized membrane protein YfhO
MRFPRLKGFANCFLIVLVIIELAVFARMTISRSSGVLSSGFIERGERYFEKDTLEAIEFIRSSDPSFYRVEKGYYSDYLNDAVVQNYFGTSAYYGFSSMPVVDFHKSLRISSQSPRIASYRYGLSKRDPLQSLLNVKYYLSKSLDDKPSGFHLIRSIGSVYVFENTNFISLGRVYSQYIQRSDFETLSLELKEKVMQRAFVFKERYEGFEQIDPLKIGNEETNESSLRYLDRTFQIDAFMEDRISGKIHLDDKGMLFFAIPYDKGWKAIVDGKKESLRLINIGFMGLPLNQGDHEIILKFIPPYLYHGIGVTFFSIILIIFTAIRFPRIKVFDIP